MKRKKSSGAGVAGSRAFHALIVPVDLTPASDRVLGRVAQLPLADDARITLSHVVPGGLSAGAQRGAERDAHKALADEIRHLRDRLPRKVRIEATVRAGAAAKEIAATATEQSAELIVMGRGGGRALRDLFLGSTAERVVRQSKLPVLVVRSSPRTPYRRPALALDLDQAAHEVVRVMLRVLPPESRRVDVIHAFDVPYKGLVYPSLSEDEAEAQKDALRARAARELTGLLASATAEADLRPEEEPFWKTRVLYGSPRIVVEKAIKKADADLLVLGTHGYSGAAYAFLGTVAGDLLRAAPCDVLVVPPVAGA